MILMGPFHLEILLSDTVRGWPLGTTNLPQLLRQRLLSHALAAQRPDPPRHPFRSTRHRRLPPPLVRAVRRGLLRRRGKGPGVGAVLRAKQRPPLARGGRRPMA